MEIDILVANGVITNIYQQRLIFKYQFQKVNILVNTLLFLKDEY